MLLALTRDERLAYWRTLSSVYTKRVRVALLNRNGQSLENLTPSLQDGAVTVDAHAQVTRALSLQLIDPKRRWGFDADTYTDGELDLTRMIRVFWVVDGPLLASPVSVPVFTGPVTQLRRDGALVRIEAQGKEAYGLTPSRRTLTIRKGARRTDAIRDILRERMGETRLGGIPNLSARLPSDVVVGPKDSPWERAQRIARSFDRQLYYDGAGVPRLRHRPTRVTWEFRGGENGGSLTSPVSVSASLQQVRNHIRVTGATPKGKKQPVMAIATADRLHPLSPWKLGPSGAPMWLTEEISNDHLRSNADCRRVADRRLRDGLRLIHDTSFNALPVPHLDPLDMVKVVTDYEAATTRLETFTLPLGVGGDMEVGYSDPFTQLRRGSRRHNKGSGGSR